MEKLGDLQREERASAVVEDLRIRRAEVCQALREQECSAVPHEPIRPRERIANQLDAGWHAHQRGNGASLQVAKQSRHAAGTCSLQPTERFRLLEHGRGIEEQGVTPRANRCRSHDVAIGVAATSL